MWKAGLNKVTRKKKDKEQESGKAFEAGPAQPRPDVPPEPLTQRAAYGLILLHDPPAPIVTHVDIIFCHGLTGSWHHTWLDLESQKPWPQSMLPRDIQNARIMTFSYDADVVNFWSISSQNTIGNHAQNLVGAVARLREETGTIFRRIIWVAHSLGGLLIKEALCHSASSPRPHIQRISQTTMGIAFLGTPHFGADLAKWANFGANLTKGLKATNTKIVGVLKPDSEVLAGIQKRFHALLDTRRNQGKPIEIVCFYEELPLAFVGLIVPMQSAILQQYEAYGIHANHKDMTKYEGREDFGYKAVVGEIRIWINEDLRQNASPGLASRPPILETGATSNDRSAYHSSDRANSDHQDSRSYQATSMSPAMTPLTDELSPQTQPQIKILEGQEATVPGQKSPGDTPSTTDINVQNYETATGSSRAALTTVGDIKVLGSGPTFIGGRQDGTFNFISNVNPVHEVERRSQVMQWLSLIPYESHHKFITSTRLPGTGSWLLARKEFTQWFSAKTSSILWLHGIPGAGKTVLSSTVVDHLLSFRPQIKLLYFYCKYSEEQRQTYSSIMTSLLRQSYSILPSPNIVDRAYNDHLSKGFSQGQIAPSEASSLLLKTLQIMDRVTYLLIDGLDECESESRLQILKFLHLVTGLEHTQVQVFVASRDNDDITLRLENRPNIYIKPEDNRSDILAFINSEINQAVSSKRLLRGKVDHQLSKHIKERLEAGSEGMFLWVQLQMLAICESKQKQDLLTVLNEMPRGLRGTYDEVLTRIQRQRPADAKLAERTFQWLLYAYQTFDAKSMSVALSINPEKDTTNQPSVEVILDCCKNLVVLDKELGILRLIHATTRMYLRERFDKEVAHRYLTITCLQHLNATLLSINFDDIPNPEKHWDSFAEKELCRYTAISWPKHRNELPQSDLTILQLELSLLFSEKHYKQWLSVLTKVKLDSISVNYDSQLAAEPSRSYNYTRGLFWDELIWLGIIESPEVHIDPLCAAIHFQLHHVVDLILNNAAMAHSILGNNERCLTALHFAAETGDVAMAKKMILAVATRHAVRKHSMVRVASPLSLASFSNQTEMVKFLLQEPSLVTAREPKACQWNALTASLYYDISRVAEILATSSVYDFKFPDNQGNIPIELAALLGNHDIFKLLLQRYNGSLPRNIVCSCLGSAIQGESKARSDIVRDLLLSYGTSSIVSFDLLLSVFDWPSIASFADLTQVLVSCIAGVHAQLHNQTKSKISFRHILDHKTQHKQLDLEHRELGHLLLQILQRANVQLAKQVVAAINPKCFHHEIGSEGNTVFHYAVRYESVELLNVLLKSQTGYLTQENRYGLTPLMEAFATRNEELILQFLQFTRVSATQRFGHQSLLGYAQRHNLKRVVEKLQHLCAGVSEWPTEEDRRSIAQLPIPERSVRDHGLETVTRIIAEILAGKKFALEDIRHLRFKEDRHGLTIAKAIIFRGDFKMWYDFLISRSVDVNEVVHQRSQLWWARHHGLPIIEALLLQLGAEDNSKELDPLDPLSPIAELVGDDVVK